MLWRYAFLLIFFPVISACSLDSCCITLGPHPSARLSKRPEIIRKHPHLLEKREESAFVPWEVSREEQLLWDFQLAAIPSVADISAIVAEGFPRPIDHLAHALKAHSQMEAWSTTTLIAAFRATIHPDSAQRMYYASYVAQSLKAWVHYGTYFGDPVKNPWLYGNTNLELIWFVGNLTRAAFILDTHSHRFKEEKVWSYREKEEFLLWLKNMEDTYLSTKVYGAGKSNRRASQIEVTMRMAALRGDRHTLNFFFKSVFVAFIHDAIQENGSIPEDSSRDKYHPQFFLASAMQMLELAKQHGMRLNPKIPREMVAIKRLAAALHYAAASNQHDQAPEGYPSVGNARANHEVPLWYLALCFLKDYGFSASPAVLAMKDVSYSNNSTLRFSTMWGFGALAVHYKL